MSNNKKDNPVIMPHSLSHLTMEIINVEQFRTVGRIPHEAVINDRR
jgi:hypothetical protein